MLKPHLQKRLDEKWNNCWPVSDLRPLALLDLISYLFFIKKLDDWDLIHKKVKEASLENFVYTKEIEEFAWSKLQNLEARQIQHLFNKEHGVIDLMNNYSHLNALYSDFFKAPLLIDPTPKLIFNSIEIINIIETSDKISQGAIVEYLFSKSKLTAQNGHEFLPEHIANLIVSLAEPQPGDVISDPSAGNGSLLINTYRYIANTENNTTPDSSNKFVETNINGVESDLIQLRLAAMNMVLHGIKDPKIRFTPPGKDSIKRKPTLVISSLLFSDTGGGANTSETGKSEKENILLNEIVESLEQGGRAVILVPQYILNTDNPAVVKTRKTIIEHFNLEAVITLAARNDSLFSNASVLVFNTSHSTTENTWFCKWGTKKKKTLNETLSNNGNVNDDFDANEVKNILHKWRNRKENQKDPSRNSFVISANYIKTNNYHLNFNDYKLIRQQEPVLSENNDINDDEPKTVLAAKKENLHEFFETSAPLAEEKKRRKLAPVFIILFILILAGGACYWFYLRDNHLHLYTRKTFPDTGSQLKVTNAPGEPEIDTTTDINNTQPNSTIPAISKNQTNETPPSAKSETTKYTVINKAWFHYQPDSSTRKPLFLEPRQDIILTPKEEKNGFVYVVYINSKGGATHGWLDKKDLEAVE